MAIRRGQNYRDGTWDVNECNRKTLLPGGKILAGGPTLAGELTLAGEVRLARFSRQASLSPALLQHPDDGRCPTALERKPRADACGARCQHRRRPQIRGARRNGAR